MRVVRLQSLDELEPLAGCWNALAQGVPFRRWEWAASWWRHYGLDRGRPLRNLELFVLAVLDDAGVLVGLAPWYLEHTASQGRIVRFLGAGEVCSEYLGLLAAPDAAIASTAALARWLLERGAGSGPDRWDVLRLAPVAGHDAALERLMQQLALGGHTISRRGAMSCWRLTLPATWEEYLAGRSKSHRKQLRRMDRDYFRSGRAVMHWVHELSQLNQAIEQLIELHQQRWRARGQCGSFSRGRFASFHRQLAPALLASGALQLGWLQLDGRPAAAEYHFGEAGVVYAYQSGIAPSLLAHQPGHLANLATIRRAIERGDQAIDFLRGAEPYKAHWGAVERPTVEYRVVATRLSARVRQGLWTAGGNMVGWLKSGWQFAESLVGE